MIHSSWSGLSINKLFVFMTKIYLNSSNCLLLYCYYHNYIIIWYILFYTTTYSNNGIFISLNDRSHLVDILRPKKNIKILNIGRGKKWPSFTRSYHGEIQKTEWANIQVGNRFRSTLLAKRDSQFSMKLFSGSELSLE